MYIQKMDGQIERSSMSLEDMLKMYVGKRQQSLDRWIDVMQFAYNQ